MLLRKVGNTITDLQAHVIQQSPIFMLLVCESVQVTRAYYYDAEPLNHLF